MDKVVLTPMYKEHNSRSIRFENSRTIRCSKWDYNYHLLQAAVSFTIAITSVQVCAYF